MSIFDDLAKPQIHEIELARFFGQGFRFDGLTHEFDAPLVCLAFSNRCGSNLLAGYLRDTPCFGGFHEQLNFDTAVKTSITHGIDNFPDYFRHLCRKPIEAGQVYGFKASWDQLMMLRRCRIDYMFSQVRVIQMTRLDIIGQAISLMIADQTRQWTSTQPRLQDISLEYRPAQLTRIVQTTAEAEQKVRILCEILGLPRTLVSYEDVVSDPGSVISRIASEVGVDPGSWVPSEPLIKRQANADNQKFRERFLTDLGDGFA